MAKATIAVAVLALALLLTGPAAAAQAGRRLKGANASSNSGGFTTGSPTFAQAGSFDQAATFTNPLASAGAAGGAGYSVAINNGKPSISAAVGEGTTLSQGGKSQSQAQSNAFNNGIPGTGAFNGINVGSSQGGASSQAITKAAALGK